MVSILANLGLAGFLLTSLVVGTRLIGLAGRTRKLPELLIGTGFVVGGVLGYVPEALLVQTEVVPDPLRGAVMVFSNGSVRLTAILVLVFTWKVFRPGDSRAIWISLGIGLPLVVSWLAFPSPWAYASSSAEWSWSFVTAVFRSTAFAWASFEAFAEWGRARRRVALGLANPVAARRLLLWGVAMAGPALMSAIPVITRHLNPTDTHAGWSLLQSLLGLVAAMAMWHTFFGARSRVAQADGAEVA